MPSGEVSIGEFLQILREGRTEITRKMDTILATMRGHSHAQAIRSPDHLDVIDAGCAQMMLDVGMRVADVDHINEWPKAMKEIVREAIVRALDDGTRLSFKWGVTEDDEERTTVQGSVVMLSTPERKLRGAVRLAEEVPV